MLRADAETLLNLKELQNNWDRLAGEDALWAVLSDDQKRGGKWDVEEFFRTGQTEIEGLLLKMEHLSLPFRRDKALDFGCGVGRLSQALASHFKEVVGVDIAPNMIQLANRFNQHGSACRFVLNQQPELRQFESAQFDVIYTNIVLQHMQPRFAKRYIKEFLRLLKVGGRVIFQIPAHPQTAGIRWRIVKTAKRVLPVSIARWFRKNPDEPRMEIYGVDLAAIVRLVESRGGQVDAIERNRWAGPGWCSYTYYASKC